MPAKGASRGAKVTRTVAKTRAGARATPDGRYIIVHGVLWRAADPNLAPDIKEDLVSALMEARLEARRAVGVALKSGDGAAERSARRCVHKAKIAKSERRHQAQDVDHNAALSPHAFE